MSTLLRFVAGLILASTLLSLPAVHASTLAQSRALCTKLDQSPKATVATIKSHLGVLYSKHCLGWYADTWTISQENFKAFSLDVNPATWQKKRAELRDNGRYQEFLRQNVLERLRATRLALTADLRDARYVLDPATGSALRGLERPMDLALGNIERGIHSNVADCRGSDPARPSCAEKRGQWKYDTVSTDFAGSDLIRTVIARDFLDPHCAGTHRTEDATCTKAYTTAKRFIRYAATTEFLMRMYVDFKLVKLSEELDLYNRQWEQYFGEARSQYPWELRFNSYRYARNLRNTEGAGASRGFKPPPSHQTILLHPTVALEYVDGATQGDRLRAALVLEWIGYNRWTWLGSKMHRPLGFSIISSLSDRASTTAISHGLMLHVNHRLSFGLTHRSDSSLGVLLSYDLVKHVTTRSEKLESEFRDRLSDFSVDLK